MCREEKGEGQAKTTWCRKRRVQRRREYAFQIEMKYTAWKLGFKIEEVPIIFTDRREGQSKMSKGIFREAVFGVINLRWRGMTGKIKPRKS